jgi:hypothetical protein
MIWYLGVAGYLWFFMHRYHIAKRRSNVINDLGLLKNPNSKTTLRKRCQRARLSALEPLSFQRTFKLSDNFGIFRAFNSFISYPGSKYPAHLNCYLQDRHCCS